MSDEQLNDLLSLHRLVQQNYIAERVDGNHAALLRKLDQPSANAAVATTANGRASDAAHSEESHNDDDINDDEFLAAQMQASRVR